MIVDFNFVLTFVWTNHNATFIPRDLYGFSLLDPLGMCNSTSGENDFPVTPKWLLKTYKHTSETEGDNNWGKQALFWLFAQSRRIYNNFESVVYPYTKLGLPVFLGTFLKFVVKCPGPENNVGTMRSCCSPRMLFLGATILVWTWRKKKSKLESKFWPLRGITGHLFTLGSQNGKRELFSSTFICFK